MAVSSVVRQSFWTRGAAATILFEMEAYRREVGARLRELRQARNMSQEDAAHAVGVTSATWGRWERGRTSPYDHNWQKLEQAFRIDAREIRGQAPSPLGLGNDGADGLNDRLQAIQDAIEALAVASARRDQAMLRLLREAQQPPAASRRQRPR